LNGFGLFHEIFDVFLNEILNLFLNLGVSLGFLGDFSAMFYHVLKCLFAPFGEVLHGKILGQVLDVGVDDCLELFVGFLEQIGHGGFSFKLREKKKGKSRTQAPKMSEMCYNVNDIISNIRLKYFKFRHTDLPKAAASALRLSAKAFRLFLAAVV